MRRRKVGERGQHEEGGGRGIGWTERAKGGGEIACRHLVEGSCDRSLSKDREGVPMAARCFQLPAYRAG